MPVRQILAPQNTFDASRRKIHWQNRQNYICQKIIFNLFTKIFPLQIYPLYGIAEQNYAYNEVTDLEGFLGLSQSNHFYSLHENDYHSIDNLLNLPSITLSKIYIFILNNNRIMQASYGVSYVCKQIMHLSVSELVDCTHAYYWTFPSTRFYCSFLLVILISFVNHFYIYFK